jgi:hypothetical protein
MSRATFLLGLWSLLLCLGAASPVLGQAAQLSVRAQNGTLPSLSSRTSPAQDLAAARLADRDAFRVQRNRQLGFPTPGFAFPTPGLALPAPFVGFPKLDPNFPLFNNGLAQPGWATSLPMLGQVPGPAFPRTPFLKPTSGLEALAGAGLGLANLGKGESSSVFVGAQFQEALRANRALPAPKVVALPQEASTARQEVRVDENMLFSRKISLNAADKALLNNFALHYFDRDQNAKLANQEAGAAARVLLAFADKDLSGTLSQAEWEALRIALVHNQIVLPRP